jgi:hypothetical protein
MTLAGIVQTIKLDQYGFWQALAEVLLLDNAPFQLIKQYLCL